MEESVLGECWASLPAFSAQSWIYKSVSVIRGFCNSVLREQMPLKVILQKACDISSPRAGVQEQEKLYYWELDPGSQGWSSTNRFWDLDVFFGRVNILWHLCFLVSGIVGKGKCKIRWLDRSLAMCFSLLCYWTLRILQGLLQDLSLLLMQILVTWPARIRVEPLGCWESPRP